MDEELGADSPRGIVIGSHFSKQSLHLWPGVEWLEAGAVLAHTQARHELFHSLLHSSRLYHRVPGLLLILELAREHFYTLNYLTRTQYSV